MFFVPRVLHIAKDAEYADEYEDAFAFDALRGIAAIADGVSSAIFSGQWAEILTRGVVANPPCPGGNDHFSAWLAECRARWAESVDVAALPWNQKQKLRQVGGGFSTLLWVEVGPVDPGGTDGRDLRIRAYAIGDSCLFHIRAGQVLQTFPIQASAEFEQDPLSICSADLGKDALLEFRTLEADCQADDLLVLATDAIAQWALTTLEAGIPPDWPAYVEMPEAAWRDHVVELRRAGRIRYDDTTLILLRVTPELQPPPSTESAASSE